MTFAILYSFLLQLRTYFSCVIGPNSVMRHITKAFRFESSVLLAQVLGCFHCAVATSSVTMFYLNQYVMSTEAYFCLDGMFDKT